MKKNFNYLCVVAALAGFSSCASTKHMATISSLEGEWNIIEISGAAVVPAPDQEFPYIAFNTENGNVYGNAGCNNMMGTFDLNAKPGKIHLSNMASTRMACRDEAVEQKVLKALATVKKYKKIDEKNMALYGSSKKDIIILQKKENMAAWNVLDGKWMIKEANGTAVPDSMEHQPYLTFDVAEKKLHGRGGCNFINGDMKGDATHASALSFGQVIRTMMFCPDMEVEENVLDALKKVASFKEENNGVSLLNAEGKQVMFLVKE